MLSTSQMTTLKSLVREQSKKQRTHIANAVNSKFESNVSSDEQSDLTNEEFNRLKAASRQASLQLQYAYNSLKSSSM